MFGGGVWRMGSGEKGIGMWVRVVRGLFHLWGVCFMLVDLGVDDHSDE